VAATYNEVANCTADGYHGSSFVAKYLPAVSQTPLAGSTIAFDRSFLRAHMESLHSKFHYRSIDASSLTELAKRWSPAVYEARPKKDDGAAHRALPDIRESIEYLRYFKAAGFINATNKGFIEQARAHRDYFKGRCPFENCDVCSSLGERMRGG
jgi:oligoribonuclease (3'-5' exoribonuclease)